MKIAYDASRGNRSERSGIEQYSLAMLIALAASDRVNSYDVYVDDDPIEELRALPTNFTLRVLRPPLLRRWLSRVFRLPLFWTEWTLSRALQQNPPDLLFVPGYIIPKHYQGKAISVVHDLGFLTNPEVYSSRERRRQIRALRRNLDKSDRIVVVSDTTAQEVRARFPDYANPIDRIYPGVDHQTYQPAPVAVRQAVMDKAQIQGPYLLYVGNLLPKKGLEILIQAFARIVEESTRARLQQANEELAEDTLADRYAAMAEQSKGLQSPISLVIVGKGDPAYLASLQAWAKQNHVGSSVRFLGYLPTDEVVALMSGALTYVQPSRYEGFGLPVVEAMACGAPVLVTDRGALPEIVAYAEAVFPADDWQALASRVQTLMDNPDLYLQLSADSQLRAHRFRWERGASELLKVFAQFKAAPESDKPVLRRDVTADYSLHADDDKS